MRCGGTQTRRRQERQGTPEGGCSALPGCPGPQLPSPGLRSDPAQGIKRSPTVILTLASESCFGQVGGLKCLGKYDYRRSSNTLGGVGTQTRRRQRRRGTPQKGGEARLSLTTQVLYSTPQMWRARPPQTSEPPGVRL